jgi:glycosyltransferase 2 family protein
VRLARWLLGSRWLRIAFALVALFFIVYAVVDQWSKIAPRLDQISVGSIVFGLLAVLAGLGSTMLAWRTLMADLGARLTLGAVAQIFFAGQLGKYVPGSVWPVIVSAELAVERGAGRKRPVAATLVQMGLTVVTGVLISAATLPFVLTHTALELVAVPIVVVLAVLGTHPRITNPCINLLFRLIRREPLEEPLSWAGVLIASAWQALGWVLFGIPVVLVTRDLGGSGGRIIALGVGALALALVAGFVVPFVPAGAGVREVLMVAILGTAVTSAAALTVALVSRLMMTIGDVITGGAAITSLGWSRFSRLRHAREGRLEPRPQD